MTKINYVTQLLISRSNTAKNHTMITIDTINANFQNYLARVTGDNGYKDKALEEEAKALIKLAYISIMAKIQEMNTEQMLGTFEEFDKTELKQQVEEEQKNIKKELLVIQQENAENGRTNNEYRTLLIPQRIPISDVTKKYIELLRAWNDDLDRQITKGEYDLEKNRKQERIIREKVKAYDMLCDPDYKMKLDELLLFNFSPNQEKRYIPNNAAEVTYLPERPRERKDPTTGRIYKGLKGLSFGSIYQGDPVETVVYHIGNIGLGRFRRNGKITYREESLAKKYKVIKFYKDKELASRRRQVAMREGSISQWDDKIGAEIFLVSGELNESKLENPNIDPEFIRYTQEVLLSTTNLEQATIYNGGYIGRVSVTPDKREYIVAHDTDPLCVSKELQKATSMLRKKEDIESMAVIYKIDEEIIELYSRDDATGKIFRETVPAIPELPKMLNTDKNKSHTNLSSTMQHRKAVGESNGER